jgi:hypothetical protein
VKVEVFANGVWGGFCGATCSVTILNPPAQFGRMGAEEAGPGTISLYPNPARDGRVQVLIDGLTTAEQAIDIEVFDLFGQRVMARQYRNSGDVFNTVLDLDASMAKGVYLVNITVDGQVTTKRLNVM